jgi:hypothetical protein
MDPNTEAPVEELDTPAGHDPQQEDQAPAPTGEMSRQEYDALNERVIAEDYDPTDEEWERIRGFQDRQNNGDKSTEAPADDVKAPDASTDPKSTDNPEKDSGDDGKSEDEKVVDLVEGVRPNKWTDAQRDTVIEAMKRVGAKTPEEIPDKIKGLQQLVSEKAGETKTFEGELETERNRNQQILAAVNDTTLREDVLKGDVNAYAYLKSIGVNPAAFGAKGTPEEQKAGADPEKPKQEDTIDEDEIIDPKAHAQIQALKDELKKVTGFVTQQNEQNQQFEQARAVQGMRDAITNQAMSVVEEFGEDYKVEGLNMRDEISKHLTGQAVDPRLGPMIKVMDFAREHNLPKLRMAHVLMNERRLPQSLADAEARGRNSVLQQPTSPAMPDVRGNSGGAPQTETWSEADVEAMANDKMDIPDSWYNPDGSYNTDIVPVHAQKRLGLVQ